MYENLAEKARQGRVAALALVQLQAGAGASRSGRNTASPKLVFLSSRQKMNTVQFLG